MRMADEDAWHYVREYAQITHPTGGKRRLADVASAGGAQSKPPAQSSSPPGPCRKLGMATGDAGGRSPPAKARGKGPVPREVHPARLADREAARARQRPCATLLVREDRLASDPLRAMP